MSTIPPPLPPQVPTPPSSMPVAVIVLIWVAWIVVIVIADFLAFMMFAFADSPSSAQAAKLMIVPIMLWFGVTFVAGILLLVFKGWWQIPLAFVLAASPPFLVFVGYNLLSGAANVSRTSAATPPAPAIPMENKPYAPPPTSIPTQPDFQKAIRDATRNATTKPEAD